MGIGRRQFLKFVATALGGLVVDPIRTITINGDYYINTTLGLGFVKPGAWMFEAFQDFATKLEGQIVQGVEPGAEEEEFRRDQASTLVATISKYGDAVRRFGPSITIFKNHEDYEGVRSRSLEQVAENAIEGYSYFLRDYELVEPPSRCDISCCRAIRFKTRWVFEHREIEPVLLEDETLAIDQGSCLYTIHLYDSPSTAEVAIGEFTHFLKSLHIA
jgi:hypothetical protein